MRNCILKNIEHKTWCGKKEESIILYFQEVDHAAADSSVWPCKKCVKEIVKQLKERAK